jgi:hypothetical protein
VEVLLQVDTLVYAGVKALKTEQIVTDNGGSVFMYLTGMPSTKYTVTIRKDGFETQTVFGTAPPDGHHTIRLKKAEKALNN